VPNLGNKLTSPWFHCYAGVALKEMANRKQVKQEADEKSAATALQTQIGERAAFHLARSTILRSASVWTQTPHTIDTHQAHSKAKSPLGLGLHLNYCTPAALLQRRMSQQQHPALAI